MQIGMIGLGRMGANMVRRLLRGQHECVVFDRLATAVAALGQENVVGASSLADLVSKLKTPRAIWMMIPGAFVEQLIADLLPHLEPGDVLIDGGNSYYVGDIRLARELAVRQIHYVDCGTSGGVMGLERGYCLAPAIFHALPGVTRSAARPNRVTCTAGRAVPDTSSQWCTTASSTV